MGRRDNKDNFRLIRQEIEEYAGSELASDYIKYLMSTNDKTALFAIRTLPWCDLKPMLDDIKSRIHIVKDTELARFMYPTNKVSDCGGWIEIQ